MNQMPGLDANFGRGFRMSQVRRRPDVHDGTGIPGPRARKATAAEFIVHDLAKFLLADAGANSSLQKSDDFFSDCNRRSDAVDFGF